MELEEAKKEVSEIIRKVIHTEEVYYLDGKYVRWGRVEKDLHAVLESLLTQRAADRCHGCGALWLVADIVENGIHVCSVCGTRR
jgi:hypothetical protein